MRAEPRFVLLLVCFFLSGLAGLIYQTAWTRQLAFVFGTSELAVVTVLAAYMGGLAAGAAAAARFVTAIRRPVLVYGLLELGVAASALAVPAAIAAATAVQVAFFGGRADTAETPGLAPALFTFVCSAAILLVPTGLMGATLPLLARHAVRREGEIGSRVGLLYATNTAGAVAGALAAGFVLLPALGLRQTTLVAAGANAAVFVAAVLMARGAPALEVPAAPARGQRGLRSAGGWILPLVLVSGTVSFGYEVLWSRLLGHLLGGSVYGFATMLAIFLAGIALGSAAAARIASNPQRAARGFAWAQVGTAGLSLAAFSALDRMPALSQRIALETGALPAADAVVAAATLLPAALCIGATFPLAVRVLARSRAAAATESARVFAWNTLGAMAGAVGAGFIVVPALGYEGALALGVVTNLMLALAAGLRRTRTWQRLAAGAAAVLFCLATLPPDAPWRLLRASAISEELSDAPVVYFGVGRGSTVLLEERAGVWRLRNNGLPEGRIVPAGGYAGGGSLPQWLAAMPSLVRPAARSILVVGLGGGVALEAVPSRVESIEVVELEPEVVAANRAIAAQRHRDPLADPRVRIVLNDARSALLLSDERYDAIVSQPSHPWTAGASHLFTREFFELARDHLSPGGILVQWMGLAFLDDSLLRALLATLVEVFPHVRVYHPAAGALLFLASEQPLAVETNAARAIAAEPEEFAALGVYRPEDVAALVLLDEAGARSVSAGAPLNTDDRNLLRMRSLALARVVRPNFRATELVGPLDPLAHATPEYDRAYLVRRLLARRLPGRARQVSGSTEDPVEHATALGMLAMATGRPRAAQRELARALELDPAAAEARGALLRLHRRAIATGADPTLPGNPRELESALIAAWRAEARGDWSALEALDPSLARSAAQDPLFADAVRLRVAWRLSEAGGPRAREAVALSDQLIHLSGSPRDLVLRARAVAATGDEAGALTTLFQALAASRPVPEDRAAARDALKLLSSLAPDVGNPTQRARLEAALLGARR